jgi:hypothetical protein
MEHVVFFTETSGKPAFTRVTDLDEAIHVVERLRNERGITDAEMHSLTPVPVSFRTYYRVEVADSTAEHVDEVAAAMPTPVEHPAEFAPAALLLAEPEPAEPEPEADDVPAADTLVALNPLDLDPVDSDVPADVGTADAGAPDDPEDDGSASVDGLVPLVRSEPDPEPERSLGYFAH